MGRISLIFTFGALLSSACCRVSDAFTGFIRQRTSRRFLLDASKQTNSADGAIGSDGLGEGSALGDLTGGLETTAPFLPNFSPLERIALTATGNLQRLISSYYNSPVNVTCVRNVEVEDGVYDREVYLSVLLDQHSDEIRAGARSIRFCRAHSTVYVRSDKIKSAISSGSVGVGQLFRFYNVLPAFRLVDAGRDIPKGTFWRTYELNSDLVSCRIHEIFLAETFELHLSPTMRSTGTEEKERQI